jgi:hypothetical protein
MTRDDIIRLAKEAGLIHYHDSEGHWTGVTNDNLIEVEENRWDDKLVRILEPFAALVAAAEREACAKVCDVQIESGALSEIEKYRAGFIADVIRSRGESK